MQRPNTSASLLPSVRNSNATQTVESASVARLGADWAVGRSSSGAEEETEAERRKAKTEEKETEGRLSKERLVRIYAGKLFDPDTLQLLPSRVLTVSQHSGLILDVRPYTPQQLADVDFAGPSDGGDGDGHAVHDHHERQHENVDLTRATVLPGLVDAHVHCECRSFIPIAFDSLSMCVLCIMCHAPACDHLVRRRCSSFILR